MAIIGTQTGTGSFIADISGNGDTNVNNPNSTTDYKYPNFKAEPSFFSGNKVIWPRVKPPEFISLVDTSDFQFQVNYGVSYLSYYFYMNTNEVGKEDYEDYFINSNGYIRDIYLEHSKEAFGLGVTWDGVWQFESADIRNIKGNISQVDITVSKQISAMQVVDKKAEQA
jgi:hypothetical protein|tara:strand:- start:43 stop:549 length:507 start_codon:yes stop_codon:yes gene_type:complete